MTPEEEYQQVCAEELEDFLRRQRVWERREVESFRARWRSFCRALLTTAITGGIFIIVLVWKLTQ